MNQLYGVRVSVPGAAEGDGDATPPPAHQLQARHAQAGKQEAWTVAPGKKILQWFASVNKYHRNSKETTRNLLPAVAAKAKYCN